ncbi:hypothetical protein HDU83_006811 [Entophlyctis luteolus]|nr:hypothetical protein HDU83_006811 [Entophlyctis luteolus]
MAPTGLSHASILSHTLACLAALPPVAEPIAASSTTTLMAIAIDNCAATLSVIQELERPSADRMLDWAVLSQLLIATVGCLVSKARDLRCALENHSSFVCETVLVRDGALDMPADAYCTALRGVLEQWIGRCKYILSSLIEYFGKVHQDKSRICGMQAACDSQLWVIENM